MKFYAKFLVVALALTTAFSACKKDEPSDPTPTELPDRLIINGTTYNVSDGFLLDYGLTGTVANFDVYLFSDGITVHYANGQPDSLSGSGQLFYLEAWSSNENTLEAGTYTISASPVAGGLTIAEFETITNGFGGTSLEISTISLEVGLKNGVHTFEGSGKTADGNDFSVF